MNYYEFLNNKNNFKISQGFNISKDELSDKLFEWQKVCVCWALKKGKSALFEACGLGKTFQQLEWANQICKKTGGNVLIVAPLGVAHQTANEEAPKLNLKVNLIRTTKEIKKGINITNYEILDQIDTSRFVGVVLDVIRPTSNVEYRENEYIDFLENESVECDVYLFVKKTPLFLLIFHQLW